MTGLQARPQDLLKECVRLTGAILGAGLRAAVQIPWVGLGLIVAYIFNIISNPIMFVWGGVIWAGALTVFAVAWLWQLGRAWTQKLDSRKDHENLAFLLSFGLIGSLLSANITYAVYQIDPSAYAVNEDVDKRARQAHTAATSDGIVAEERGIYLCNVAADEVAASPSGTFAVHREKHWWQWLVPKIRLYPIQCGLAGTELFIREVPPTPADEYSLTEYQVLARVQSADIVIARTHAGSLFEHVNFESADRIERAWLVDVLRARAQWSQVNRLSVFRKHQYRAPLSLFVFDSISRVVGASSDSITPVSRLAMMVDCLQGLWRTLLLGGAAALLIKWRASTSKPG